MILGVLVLKDLRRQWRDRQALIINLLLPLALTAAMGFAFGGGLRGGGTGISAIPLAIVADGVPSLARDWFDEQLRGSELFATTWTDSAGAMRLVERGKVKAAVILPGGLLRDYFTAEEVAIGLWKDPNSEIKAGIVEEILRRSLFQLQSGEAVSRALWPDDYEFDDDPFSDLMTMMEDGDFFEAWDFVTADENDERWRVAREDFDRISAHQRMLNEELSRAPLHFEVEDRVAVIEAEETKPVSRNRFDHVLPNMAVFFLLFGVAASLKDIHRERAQRTLHRTVLTRGGAQRFLLGKWLGATIAGTVQVLLLFAAGAVVFRVNLGPDPWSLLVVTLMATAAAAAVFLLLSVLMVSEQQMDRVSPILVLVMAMFGGTFVSMESMSGLFQILARCTFTWWANSAFAEVVAADLGLRTLGTQLGVLCGISVGTLALSAAVWWRRMREGVAA